MIDVSIVLLNWNSKPVVFDAAASAIAQRGVTTELVVVDNGSQDGSLEELKGRFPASRFIEMGFNSGFTGGMNAGTDAARAEFVLWQNADLVLAPDYCQQAVAAMRADPGLGATGGLVRLLVNGRPTEEFDACGYTLATLHRVAFVRQRQTAQDVVGVSGSCPIFRRSALDSLRSTVGYVLDPWYFTYGEDIDVMLRLNLAGWRVRYLPSLLAWHVRSGSTVARSRFYEKPNVTQVHHFKNRLATIIKTYPLSLYLLRLPILAAAEIALPAYLLLRRGPRSVANWFQAWRELWRERRRLQRDRSILQRGTTPERVRRLRNLLRRA
jgi:GT2 family glycosyltransferase